MLERERKYRLSIDESARLTALLEREGVLERCEIQDNVRYAERTGSGARVDLRLRTVAGRQELTLKGPRLEGGPSKVREELNVAVSGDVGPFLEALGFAPALTYRKRTSIYTIGGATVSVDDVEGLGLFCEVEATDDDVIEVVARRLSLDATALEQRGYARLVKDARDAGDSAGSI
ncbi:MAG: CYTH domain-containing protein [Chloroflexota bacterium]|nr:CYTH domain-containing protein [Chloroflexota bacterium]